jgi:hypothetical protein
MERFILDTGDDRQLQHDCKYHSMPLQVQNQLQLELFDIEM